MATVGDLKENDGVSTDAYPLDTRIERCHMHEIGVTGKQTSALFSATSGRTVFKHNVAYNGPVRTANLATIFELLVSDFAVGAMLSVYSALEST
eukprot:SAG11_NODE_326_length_10708_cov_6.937035_7_plen_94_part_00